MKRVYLKPGKEIPVKAKHHWLFSGAVKKPKDRIEDGEIVAVYSDFNQLLGHGYFNNNTTIQVRMLNFNNQDPLKSLEENIVNAVNLRSKFFDDNTNTYRVINGEGDLIPGLTVDRYNNVLVIQIATIGIEQLKDTICDILIRSTKHWNIKTIYEKSNMSARQKDGLSLSAGFVWGEKITRTEVLENGIKFDVDLVKSQKTGLFLDMREMRKLVGEVSKGKKVLNCFSYTGGFSLYAAKGGASQVTSVDIDKGAIETCKKNFEINIDSDSNFGLAKHEAIATDAFKFLNDDSLQYDFIILDPPAFAKKKEDVPQAKRGYGQINRITLSKMPKNSFLLACSCSYHVGAEEFEQIIKKSASEANRTVKILARHHLAPDHPININHSELDYLKSLLLYVE